MLATENENPNFLYKYMPPKLDRIEPIMTLNRLYFTPPSVFNDPFDCATAVDFSGADEQTLREYHHFIMRFKDRHRSDDDIRQEAEYGIAQGYPTMPPHIQVSCSSSRKRSYMKPAERIKYFVCLIKINSPQ